jgi:hypothetical protein
MREYDIYSTKTSKWYSYLMPGDQVLPAPREGMCWTVTSADDGSSHQIIIYGGVTSDNLGLDDDSVWALSIPSFDWVQLTPENSTGTPGKRTRATCTLIGNKYMLGWGGIYLGTPQNSCDKDGNAVYLFDISKGEWVQKFEPKQEYLIPENVVKVIGGRYPPGLPCRIQLTSDTAERAAQRSLHPMEDLKIPISTG